MMKSDDIKDLAKALSMAQGEIENAHKNAANPFFNSKYADLSAVLSECRTALSKHGLSFVQTTAIIESKLHLVTTLMHASGQWLESSMPIIMGKQDMQGMGSALTYGRRYAIAAICGIHQEDDDGNSASQKHVHPVEQFEKPQVTNHAPKKPHEESIEKLQKQITTMPDHVHTWRPYRFDAGQEQCDYRHNGKFCNALRPKGGGPDFDDSEGLPF